MRAVLPLVLSVQLVACTAEPGKAEAYKPEKPITFPHDIHTGTNKIDCRYCHNAVGSDSLPVPATAVCGRCHKQVKGRTPEEAGKTMETYDEELK